MRGQRKRRKTYATEEFPRTMTRATMYGKNGNTEALKPQVATASPKDSLYVIMQAGKHADDSEASD